MNWSISNEGISIGFKTDDVDVSLGTNLQGGVPSFGAKIDVAGTGLEAKADITGHSSLAGKTTLGSNEYKASVGVGGLRGPDIGLSVEDVDGSGGISVRANAESLGLAVKAKIDDDEFAYSLLGNSKGDTAIQGTYKSSDGAHKYAADFKNHHQEGYSARLSGRHRSGRNEYKGSYRTDSAGNHDVDGSYQTSDGSKQCDFRGRKSRDGHYSGGLTAHHKNREREIRTEFDAGSRGSSRLKGSYEKPDSSEKYEIEGHNTKGRYSGKASGFRKSHGHITQASFEGDNDGVFRGMYSRRDGSQRSEGQGSRDGRHNPSKMTEDSLGGRNESKGHWKDGQGDTPSRRHRDGRYESKESSDEDDSDGSSNYTGGHRRYRGSSHGSRGTYHQSHESRHQSSKPRHQSRGSHHQSDGSHYQSPGSRHHSHDSDHQSDGTNYQSRGSHHRSHDSHHQSDGTNYQSCGSQHRSHDSHHQSDGTNYQSRGSHPPRSSHHRSRGSRFHSRGSGNQHGYHN